MIYGGDIPTEHLKTMTELRQLEAWFNEYGDDVPVLMKAKGLVCMAHDWYWMGMEEEGSRLLLKVESYCPGYFKGPILVQVRTHPDFAFLVANLVDNDEAFQIMSMYGFDHEQI